MKFEKIIRMKNKQPLKYAVRLIVELCRANATSSKLQFKDDTIIIRMAFLNHTGNC